MRAARAIVDTEIVVAADTHEKKALATRVVWNDMACRGQVKAQDDNNGRALTFDQSPRSPRTRHLDALVPSLGFLPARRPMHNP